MKPEAFSSSTSSCRKRAVSARLVFGMPTACGISMKRPGMSRYPGCAATNSVIGSLTPAAASRLPSTNSVVPSVPRTTEACRSVRVRNRSYAEPRFTPIRTPALSTSATVARGEPTGTAYTPSISVYGAVKAISAARAGSTARKQTSASPATSASNESRAPSKQENSHIDAKPGGDLPRDVDGDSAGCRGRALNEHRVVEVQRGPQHAARRQVGHDVGCGLWHGRTIAAAAGSARLVGADRRGQGRQAGRRQARRPPPVSGGIAGRPAVAGSPAASLARATSPDSVAGPGRSPRSLISSAVASRRPAARASSPSPVAWPRRRASRTRAAVSRHRAIGYGNASARAAVIASAAAAAAPVTSPPASLRPGEHAPDERDLPVDAQVAGVRVGLGREFDGAAEVAVGQRDPGGGARAAPPGRSGATRRAAASPRRRSRGPRRARRPASTPSRRSAASRPAARASRPAGTARSPRRRTRPPPGWPARRARSPSRSRRRPAGRRRTARRRRSHGGRSRAPPRRGPCRRRGRRGRSGRGRRTRRAGRPAARPPRAGPCAAAAVSPAQ